MDTFKAGDRVVFSGTTDFWYVVNPNWNGHVICRRFKDDHMAMVQPGLLSLELPPGSLGVIPQEYLNPDYVLSPIISAGYGAGSRWTDVTNIIRRQYEEGRRVFIPANEEFGDSFVGALKCLYIVWLNGIYLQSFMAMERMGKIELP